MTGPRLPMDGMEARLCEQLQRLADGATGVVRPAALRGLLSRLGLAFSDADVQALLRTACPEGALPTPEQFVASLFAHEAGEEGPRGYDVSRSGAPPEWAPIHAKQFPFRGYIERTEHRAITLPQLRGIAKYVARHCHKWVDTAPPEHSRTAGRQLAMDFANLYHVNSWLILPATAERSCAFVELVAGGPQPPSWFVSHWWGEPLADFVACVQLHSRIRGLGEDAAFWVCAYANRQHSLQDEIASDPRQTSFYRAMKLAVGVLLILDDAGPATAFTRVWCAFEESEALTMDREAAMLLDIAASHGSTAELLTDGLASTDAAKDFPTNVKMRRESSFPLRVLKAGLSVKLEEAQASVQQDRTRILNCLAQRDLDLEPPLSDHENYAKVNRRLASLFAIAAWAQAVQKGLMGELGLVETLRADAWRTVLAFDFSACGESLRDADVADLARGLCPSLAFLGLNFRNCRQISEAGLAMLAPALPASLRHLSLDFSRCQGVDDAGASALAACLPPSLEELTLSFTACKQLGDAGVEELAHCLPRGLVQLSLLLRECDSLTDAGAVGLARWLPRELVQLALNLTGCKELRDGAVEAIAEALPPGLRRLALLLTLDARVGDAGLAALGRSLPTGLEELELGLQDCALVTDVGLEALARGMGGTALQRLTLDLVRCKCITDAGVLAVAGHLPPGLAHFSVSLRKTPVSEAIRNSSLEQLRELQSRAVGQGLG